MAALTGSSNGESTEAFTYSPISKHHIRLLRFSHVGDKAVVVKLAAFKLGHKKCQKYIALSYTWGDQSETWTGTMTVDGKRTRVLASLGPFIKVLQSHPDRWEGVWWWIDSICINQENDGEKSTQVGQMGEIYRCAAKVIVWLGEESAMSNMAIDFLHHIGKKRRQAAAECPGSQAAMSKRLKELGLISEKCRPKWNAVNELFHLPWWTRVWTLQEFVIPRHLIIWCGTKTIRRESLTDGLYGMWLCHDPQVFGSHGFPIDEKAFNAAWNRRRLLQYAKQIEKGKSSELSLVALVAYFSNHNASKPRDRLFSLRGLAADSLKLIPDAKIDYAATVDTAQVYSDLVRSFIQKHQSLDIICFAEIFRGDASSDSSRLPSWVPDWRSEVDPTVVPLMVSQSAGCIGNLRPRTSRKPSVFYAASGTKKPSVIFDSPFVRSITCKGILLDLVDGLGGLPGGASHVPSTSVTNTTAVRNGGHEDRNVNQCLAKTICRCLTLDRRDTYLGDPAPIDQFLEDFEYLCGAPISTNSNIEGDFESWMRLNETLKIKGVDIRSLARQADELKSRSREPVDSIHEASFLRRFRDTTMKMKRRLMVSESGRLGMVSVAARKGDVICILFGCSVPTLLRPRSADSYEFVGECYLDGFMNGEALGGIKRKIDHVRFRIY